MVIWFIVFPCLNFLQRVWRRRINTDGVLKISVILYNDRCAKKPNTKFSEMFAMSESITRINENLSLSLWRKQENEEATTKETAAFWRSRSLRDREERLFPPFSSDTLKLLYKTGLDPCEKHDEKNLTRRSQESMKLWLINLMNMSYTPSFLPFLSEDSTSKWDTCVHLRNTRVCVFTCSVACSGSYLCYDCWCCFCRWSWWCRCWCWCRV